mmetsp:Transcript_6016/g.13372  ORF Transcript_6016/g.13372 Transcript_6016/m.13372 type:complete len:744 (-) Transcript_6016:184-2415(-)
MSYSMRKVFSREDKDWKAARDNHETDGLSKDDTDSALHRVSSKVKGKYTSGDNLGNVETVIHSSEAPSRPPLSGVGGSPKQQTSSPRRDYAMRKVASTPYGSSSPSSFNASANANSGISYAMKKVFSRESEKDWDTNEIEGLVSRVSSRLLDEGEGAELVLDEFGGEDTHDDGSDEYIANEGRLTNNKKHAHFQEEEEEKGTPSKNKVSGGYSLRRIFSTPHGNQQQQRKYRATPSSFASSELTRTASYDHHSSSSSSLYHDEEHTTNSKGGSKLNTPITLVRRPISRLKTNKDGNGKSNVHGISKGKAVDEDDVTVAESIDSNFSGRASSNKEGRKEHYSKLKRVFSKKVIAAMMLTAFGVVGVGVFLATSGQKHDDGGGTVNSSQNTNSASSVWSANNDSGGGDPENKVPTSVIQESDSASLFAAEDTDPPTSSPSNAPTTQPPTSQPSSSPTKDSTITFYIMADAPYSDYERNTVVPNVIDDLPSDAEFLVHLGDLQYAQEDQCREFAYIEASAALRRSKVPVFVLPGDNDMNDCDDHDEGVYFWKKYFYKIDEEWNHSFDLTRWGELDESFSFLHNGVLFFGINIIGGSPYSNTEKKNRHAEILSRLKSTMNARKDEYELVVLLGHAEPSSDHNDLFRGSDGLATFVEDMGKPFIHFHGDYHWWYEEEGSFGVDNYMRISLDSLITEENEVAPPIKVMIDSKRKNPVRVSRRKSGWDVDCCSNGWPRLSDDDETSEDEI